jgi:hypothetical protein
MLRPNILLNSIFPKFEYIYIYIYFLQRERPCKTRRYVVAGTIEVGGKRKRMFCTE